MISDERLPRSAAGGGDIALIAFGTVLRS